MCSNIQILVLISMYRHVDYKFVEKDIQRDDTLRKKKEIRTPLLLKASEYLQYRNRESRVLCILSK